MILFPQPPPVPVPVPVPASCEHCGAPYVSGRLVGRLLTYGERAIDRAELFERGALTWPADGVVLNRQHARGAPIMRVMPTLVGDELRIDQALPDTVAGRDAATEIRAGLMRGLSVSFQAQRQAFAGGVRRISQRRDERRSRCASHVSR